MMIESNLVEGKQKLVFGEADKLEWGKSITDSCINIQSTKELILRLYENLNYLREIFCSACNHAPGTAP